MLVFKGKKTKLQAGDRVIFTLAHEADTIQFDREGDAMQLARNLKSFDRKHPWPLKALHDCVAYISVLGLLFDLSYELVIKKKKLFVFEMRAFHQVSKTRRRTPSPAPAT